MTREKSVAPIQAAALSLALLMASPVSAASLVDLAEQQDSAAVLKQISQHANVWETSANGSTALHWAAHWGDEKLVAALIKAGADSNAVNRYGVTPLAEAAVNPSGNVTAMLLKAGANPNAAMGEGETVLMTAASAGNLPAVVALLAAGADANAHEQRRGQTALMWAASKGHTEVVKQLTAHGAAVNVHEQPNERPAGRVVQAGGGTMPAGGLTALLYAAREGRRDTLIALLDAGAEINQKDLEGWTALLLAIVNTHYSVAADLVARGADLELPNERGLRPLYAAVEMRLPDVTSRPLRPERDSMSSLDLVAVLLKAGADPNGRIPAPKGAAGPGGGAAFGVGTGGTAFMRATRGGDLEAMRLLMQNGADATLTRDDQTNAIMIAAGIGRAGFGSTPQTRPVGDLKAALDLCRQSGVDIDALNGEGNSALHGAASAGDLVMLRVLVESGIRTDLRNKEGLTALDVADGKGAGARGRKPTPQPEAAAALRTLLGMDAKVAGT